MSKDNRSMAVVPERRSRPRKRIVLLIDEDSQSCDRVACRLEVEGYHVLTAVNLRLGLELVKVRTPDAVVWRHGVTEDGRWTVCQFVGSQLPPRARAVRRGVGPTADRGSGANTGYLRVALVHEPSDPDQLATVLAELLKGTDDSSSPPSCSA